MSTCETTVIVAEEEPPSKRPKIVPSCAPRRDNEPIITSTCASKSPRHPLCCSTGYPLEIVRASGQYVYPSNGEKYIDARSGTVWHCHPDVVEAGRKQMETLCTNSRFLYDSMVTYAKRLCATFPGKLSCCIFTNSGSEANELAVQIAEAVSGGSKIVALRGASHGHVMTQRRLTAASSDLACPVPQPDVYRGEHRDPGTAGELYAVEVGKIMAEQDTKVVTTGSACSLNHHSSLSLLISRLQLSSMNLFLGKLLTHKVTLRQFTGKFEQLEACALLMSNRVDLKGLESTSGPLKHTACALTLSPSGSP